MNMPKAILGVRREANTTGKYDPNIDPFQRIVPDEMMADIHYLIDRANIRKGEIQADDVIALEQYTKKANEILGWKSTLGLEDALASAWKWQLQQV